MCRGRVLEVPVLLHELEARKILPALFIRSLTCVIDKRGPFFSDNSDTISSESANELSEVVAPSLPMKRAEECALLNMSTCFAKGLERDENKIDIDWCS